LAWETVAPLAERLRGLTSGYILKIATGTGAATGASLIGRPPSSSHSVIEHAEF
jgi:hypothetical protein